MTVKTLERRCEQADLVRGSKQRRDDHQDPEVTGRFITSATASGSASRSSDRTSAGVVPRDE